MLRALRAKGVPKGVPHELTCSLHASCTLTVLKNTPTERLALLAHSKLPRGVEPGNMLELHPRPPKQSPTPTNHWASPDSAAIGHPGIAGMARIAKRYGHSLVIDTSLCAKELSHIGAYYNEHRKCVAIAVDTLWHELVHEMVHLDIRYGSASQGRKGPLNQHLDSLRKRGFSAVAAEEMLCKEHELYVIDSSGFSWSLKKLVVFDHYLRHIQEDILAVPSRERTSNQVRELRRANLLRVAVTSQGARLLHGVLSLAGMAVVAGALTRSCLGM